MAHGASLREYGMQNKENPMWYGRQDGLDRLAVPIFNEADEGEFGRDSAALAGVVAGVILSSPDGFYRICSEWATDLEMEAGEVLGNRLFPDEDPLGWEKGTHVGMGEWDVTVHNFGVKTLNLPHIPAGKYEIITVYCHTGGDCGPVIEYYLRPREG